MSQYFFESSKTFIGELEDFFDFAWPTAIAKWHLRRQVAAYVADHPSPSQEELNEHFAKESGLGKGNLTRSCIERSWENERQQFAEFLLVNIVALYESWTRGTLQELHHVSDEFIKYLQFPTATLPTGEKIGVGAVLDFFTVSESTFLKPAFYPILGSRPDYSLPVLENLLHCYRYFKECRNAIVHNGRRATHQLFEAYQAYAPVATPAHLGVHEVPQHEPITIGDKTAIHLRGIVGLSIILKKTVRTIDAELSRSAYADRRFRGRWAEKHGKGITLKIKPNDQAARLRRVARMCKTLDLPEPQSVTELEAHLTDRRYIR